MYTLIALLVIVLLYKGKSYFNPAPATSPAPAPGSPAPKWKDTRVIIAGSKCPDSTWTMLSSTLCVK